MDWICSSKGPLTPSAQICSCEMSFRFLAVGGLLAVGSPVNCDHLLVNEVNGRVTFCKSDEADTLKQTQTRANCESIFEISSLSLSVSASHSKFLYLSQPLILSLAL